VQEQVVECRAEQAEVPVASASTVYRPEYRAATSRWPRETTSRSVEADVETISAIQKVGIDAR
jgi:hypothetical protein